MGTRRPPLWAPEALSDLSEIWSYYAGVAGSATADKVVQNISRATKLIQGRPYGGRSRDEIRSGLRSVLAEPYVVFYRLSVDDDVQIVRVLHGRRDIDEIFADDLP
jgi:toxin ParE1/3/4